MENTRNPNQNQNQGEQPSQMNIRPADPSMFRQNWGNYSNDDPQSNLIKKQYQQHLAKLDGEFEQILTDIKEMKERPEAFKQHNLPLARIKKIMKSDEDVKVSSIILD